MTSTNDNKKMKPKQIIAIVCLVLLVLIYLLALLAAIFKFPGSDIVFRVALAGTFIVPILSWRGIWIYGKMMNKRTIATVFNGPSEEEVLEARMALEKEMAEKKEKEND